MERFKQKMTTLFYFPTTVFIRGLPFESDWSVIIWLKILHALGWNDLLEIWPRNKLSTLILAAQESIVWRIDLENRLSCYRGGSGEWGGEANYSSEAKYSEITSS